jgi:hypothetical protein
MSQNKLTTNQNPGADDQIHVTVSFDGELVALIGAPYQDWEIPAGLPFVELFANIAEQFPVLTATYPPGSVGIVINGTPVTDPLQLLADGDVVGFVAPVFAQNTSAFTDDGALITPPPVDSRHTRFSRTSSEVIDPAMAGLPGGGIRETRTSLDNQADEFLSDNCLVCQATKQAQADGRALTEKELTNLFRQAETKPKKPSKKKKMSKN